MSDGEYHARLSPSGASGWMNCASWESDSEGSHFANEGTAAHTLASMVLRSPGIDCDDFLGERIRVGEESFEVTKDMAAYVQTYVDYVRELARDKMLFVEQAVPIGHLTGEEGATGTADAIIVDAVKRSITVVDLKYGMGVLVDPVENEQMQMYALGSMEELWLVADFDHATMVIHQPRISEDPSVWGPIDAKHLHAFAERVGVAAARKGDGTYNPGTKQCRWCAKSKNASCPAQRDEVAKALGSEPPATAEDFAALAPDAIDDKTGDNWLAVAMAKADLVEHWLKSVRAEVERRLLAGKTVSGYKIVQGRQGPRKWIDDGEAAKGLAANGVPQDEVYQRSVVSPTEAEKRFKKKYAAAWTAVQAHIVRSSGSLSVAPESDPRPAASVTATASDFAEFVNNAE